jgi:hypothetical protein
MARIGSGDQSSAMRRQEGSCSTGPRDWQTESLVLSRDAPDPPHMGGRLVIFSGGSCSVSPDVGRCSSSLGRQSQSSSCSKRLRGVSEAASRGQAWFYSGFAGSAASRGQRLRGVRLGSSGFAGSGLVRFQRLRGVRLGSAASRGHAASRGQGLVLSGLAGSGLVLRSLFGIPLG